VVVVTNINDMKNEIDNYIEACPLIAQDHLVTIRKVIASVVPEAIECISYKMPAFKQNGILVYFAANKNHLGFYPTGSGVVAFENQLTGFTFSKGAIQFPYDQPLPIELIRQIVAYRQQVDAARTKAKKSKKKRQ
jgi:uncharacterized protein YdhG (YjbR/CyaY superfamily)